MALLNIFPTSKKEKKMKKVIALCVAAATVATFGEIGITERRKLADEIVMGENTDFCLNGFPASNRVCIIVKGGAFEVASNRYVKIGTPIKDRALYYLYFNDIKEITNTIGRCWSDIDKEGLFQISNKVWYSHLKCHKYWRTDSERHAKYCSLSENYVVKKGYLWEIGAFSSVVERMNDAEELAATKKMILRYSKLSGAGWKAKFEKLKLYARSKCLCKLSNYYNYAFRDKRTTHYSVEIRIDGETFYGYVEKDSYFGECVFKTLSDGKSHMMTLGVSYPLSSDENGGGWGEHVVIVFASEYDLDVSDEAGLDILAKLQTRRMKGIRKDVNELGDLIKKSSAARAYSPYEFDKCLKKYASWKILVGEYDIDLKYEK